MCAYATSTCRGGRMEMNSEVSAVVNEGRMLLREEIRAAMRAGGKHECHRD